DFTSMEARHLAQGFANPQAAKALVERVFYWTGGQPYLTQRLCSGLAEKTGPAASVAQIDDVCQELFLSQRARQDDDNLLFVRDRMLLSDVDKAGLLELYENVHRGRRVRDDEANPLVS